MNIVFIGHVDAGKSTIGGQILYLTVRGRWGALMNGQTDGRK
jgi:sulfate adenylyltransferase subunit 1 (EFTu-like GTPase family)